MSNYFKENTFKYYELWELTSRKDNTNAPIMDEIEGLVEISKWDL